MSEQDPAPAAKPNSELSPEELDERQRAQYEAGEKYMKVNGLAEHPIDDPEMALPMAIAGDQYETEVVAAKKIINETGQEILDNAGTLSADEVKDLTEKANSAAAEARYSRQQANGAEHTAQEAFNTGNRIIEQSKQKF